MVRRYELTAQWVRIESLRARGRPGAFGRGQSVVRQRRSLGASGSPLARPAAGYGKWKSVHRHAAKAGVWERVFDALTADRQ